MTPFEHGWNAAIAQAQTLARQSAQRIALTPHKAFGRAALFAYADEIGAARILPPDEPVTSAISPSPIAPTDETSASETLEVAS